MANDLLKKLEEKINSAIETIELSRIEVSDLREQNEELENRYADWETRLSTLIEKFEQLEDGEAAEVEEEVNAAMQDTEEESEEEVEAVEAVNSEEAEDQGRKEGGSSTGGSRHGSRLQVGGQAFRDKQRYARGFCRRKRNQDELSSRWRKRTDNSFRQGCWQSS